MSADDTRKTAIVTGAAGGIGRVLVSAALEKNTIPLIGSLLRRQTPIKGIVFFLAQLILQMKKIV